jgi:hypothetical protein
VPFEEIAANIIGPWSIDINGQFLQIQALTIMDTTTRSKTIARSTLPLFLIITGSLAILVLSDVSLINVVNSPAAPFNLCSFKM